MSTPNKKSKIVKLTNYQEYLAIISEIPCVVKLTASWCGPCKIIAPKYAAIAEEHDPLISFFEVDIDKGSEIAAHENVMGVPTFLFYHHGKVVSSFSGASQEKLYTNVKALSTSVKLDELLEEESKNPPVDDEELYQEIASMAHSMNNEYGEDCEILIEKTIPDDITSSIKTALAKVSVTETKTKPIQINPFSDSDDSDLKNDIDDSDESDDDITSDKEVNSEYDVPEDMIKDDTKEKSSDNVIQQDLKELSLSEDDEKVPEDMIKTIS